MLIIAADNFVEVVNQEGYGVPIGAEDYVWGSNASILNNALVMALAYDFTGDEKYLNGVVETANYILGRNAINQSYVSGYGAVTMEHPHHRFWANTGNYPPPSAGALAGGANGSLADPYAIEHVSGLPPARSYIDHVDSYSTNEVAINWNSPLVWVMSYLDEQFNGE
jgi:endoglucanase